MLSKKRIVKDTDTLKIFLGEKAAMVASYKIDTFNYPNYNLNWVCADDLPYLTEDSFEEVISSKINDCREKLNARKKWCYSFDNYNPKRDKTFNYGESILDALSCTIGEFNNAYEEYENDECNEMDLECILDSAVDVAVGLIQNWNDTFADEEN